MSKIKILTQNDCTKCDMLKKYMVHGIGEPYLSDVEWVHKEKDPESYEELVEKFEIMTTPAIIIGEKVLLNTTPLQVNSFLRDNT